MSVTNFRTYSRHVAAKFLGRRTHGVSTLASRTWGETKSRFFVIAVGPNVVQIQVVLELGTHAEFVPHDRFTIRSFAAEEFPDVVADGDVAVN